MENEPNNEPQDAYVPGDDGEALQPFDVREQTAKSGFLKLMAGLGFLLFLAFIVSRLFASGTRDRDQTPRITADNTPYKEEPKDPGGIETPDQDKKIYDVLKGDKVETNIKTVPVTEEPLARPKADKPAANIVIKEKPKLEPKPEPKKVAPPNKTKTPAPTASKKPAVKPKPVKTGDYVVQVASLRSQAEAQAMWNKLKSKMGGTLSADYYADIKRADLGARGVYYRLRIGGIGGHEMAKSVCQKLKANNQDCIVTKR